MKEKQHLEKSYVGRIGEVSFGGIQITVKVLGERVFMGRKQVFIKPISGNGGVWKYVANVSFDK